MKKIEMMKRDLEAKRSDLQKAIAENADNVSQLRENVESIMAQIDAQKALDDAELALKGVQEDPKEARQFSFQSFLREAMAGKLTGLNAEMHQEAQREAREFNRTISNFGIPSMALRAISGNSVSGQGGVLVADDRVRYYAALQNKLALTQAGANFLTGLVGNVPVVSGGTFNGEWLAEGADASNQTANMTGYTMTPKRLAIMGAVTRQLLAQGSVDVEALIVDAIVSAHAQALEAAAIAGSGSSNQPKGILNTAGIGSVAMGTNGSALTHKAVVELESQITAKNVDNNALRYVTNAKVVAAMKTTSIDTGSGRMIYDGQFANGFEVLKTNNVPANLTKGSGSNLSALIFGDFSKLLIGTWGGLDILVDPYVLGASGQVRFIMDTYHDVAVAQPDAFAAIKDIIA